jgi:hypothetical protein
MRSIILAVGFLLLVASNAMAADGLIIATSFQKFPAKSAIAVRPWDDSDANLKIKTLIENALRAAGHEVSDHGPMVLSFDSLSVLGMWAVGDRRSIVEFQSQTGGAGGTQDNNARVLLNLYSSDRGGALNPGEPPPNVQPSRYFLELTLDRPDGVRAWEGQASAYLSHTDEPTLSALLVPPLIGQLGKTVRRMTVKLPEGE